MDYLTPIEKRTRSFKEFMEEWIIEHFLRNLNEFGLKKPWYWETFMDALESYHHMVYLSAYTYRAATWFNFVIPSPEERAWLHLKYPKYWPQFEQGWAQVIDRWENTDPGNDFGVHGTAIPAFCNLCQLILSNGTPEKNTATTLEFKGKKYIFCSELCRWIFEKEPERYAGHRDLVKRVLEGEAPANIVAMLQRYFGLTFDTWGKDLYGGEYPWLKRKPPSSEATVASTGGAIL
jgi:toluene monooxygenase system protein A